MGKWFYVSVHRDWHGQMCSPTPDSLAMSMMTNMHWQMSSLLNHSYLILDTWRTCSWLGTYLHPSWILVACSDVEYPSEIHPKFKSCSISFVHNIHFSCSIILRFCTEHGSITAVLCVKFQNDWATGKRIMGKWDFTRFEFKTSFIGIS